MPHPPGALARPKQAQIEQSLDHLAHTMDGLFRIPVVGWRFGLDAIVGLVPGVGDTLTSFASFYVLAAAVRYRVPKATLLRMGMNIALDYVFGSVPVIGDLFDAFWKANTRNVALLRRHAMVSADQARGGRFSDWLFVGGIMALLVVLLCASIATAIYLLSLVASQLA
jgi:hypothetical protein